MKKINILYWIFTGLLAVMMTFSAIPDVLSMPIAIKGFGELGFPAYLVPFLGIAKLLGVIAILVPGNPRLKEWAYAGLAFDLIGATYSIIMVGKPTSDWAPMVLPIALLITSYLFYHRRLNLKATLVNVPQPSVNFSK